MCLECYGLDPCHYFSSPGLSWDATLKITKIELELISNIDMYLFVEKEMREISKAMKSYNDNIDQWVNIFLTVNLNS